MIYADGSEYDGEWKDDKTNGHGTYAYADGGEYVGQWKKGKKHGQGTYTSPDNYKYAGQFKEGKPYGQGMMAFSDGSKYEGQWNNGKFVSDMKSHKKLMPGQEKIAKGSAPGPKIRVEKIKAQQAYEGQGTSTEPEFYPYTIHVSSYQDVEKANSLAMMLKKKGLLAFTCPTQIPGKGEYYRIFVGFFRTFKETRAAASKLKGQKNLYPLEAKMPYAIQVGIFDSDQERKKLEAELLSKSYLAYSIPEMPKKNKARLLIGAFRKEKDAEGLTIALQKEGFEAKVVKR
jgi:cell division septation protein DedD